MKVDGSSSILSCSLRKRSISARRCLGCTTDSFPISYLGLPLGAKFKDESIWELVVERFETTGGNQIAFPKGEH